MFFGGLKCKVGLAGKLKVHALSLLTMVSYVFNVDRKMYISEQ